MKLLAIAPLALLVVSCTRADSRSHDAPVSSANVAVAVMADANVAPPFDAGITLDAYCRGFLARNDSSEGFSCRGDKAHAACDVTQKKALATLGKIVRVDEKGPDGTRTLLAIVDPGGHFTILEAVPTEECDLGDPADVSLELVSATESAEGGAPSATVVFDSLRNDPPFQSGSRILSAERRSIRCRAGAAVPVCDKPTTLGTFAGPATSDKPPPFSQWKKN